jgi:branched-chain amino acid transport system permease protein
MSELQPERQVQREALDALVLLGGLCALIAAVTALTTLGPTSLELTGMNMLVNLMIVVGLYIFVGNSGVFSFGSLFFVQVGAYVGAMLIIPTSVKNDAYPELYAWLRHAHSFTIAGIVIGGLAAMIAAAVLALPLMRLSGLSAALGTFVVLVIGNVVFTNWDKLTGGSPGVSGIPSMTIWIVLVWALVCVGIAWSFQQTTWCRRLRASREDEIAARAIGVRVARERTIAFTLSALTVGIAGVVFGQVQQGIYPNAFYLDTTFVTLAMLVVGGMRSLTGAVVGAISLSALAELLSRLQNGLGIAGTMLKIPVGSQQVGFALAMLVVLLLRPAGITGGKELSFGALRALPRWSLDKAQAEEARSD